MNKHHIFLTASLLCLTLSGCAGKESKSGTVISEPAEQIEMTEEVVADAGVILDRLGIDMSMAEKTEGASNFEYSIVGDTVGQVRFTYVDTEICWIASMEYGALSLLGIASTDDDTWMGTTLDAVGVAGADADDSLTGITCVNVNTGGCAYSWNWHGIKFDMLAPWECGVEYSVDGFIYRIATNSYLQPGA